MGCGTRSACNRPKETPAEQKLSQWKCAIEEQVEICCVRGSISSSRPKYRVRRGRYCFHGDFGEDCVNQSVMITTTEVVHSHHHRGAQALGATWSTEHIIFLPPSPHHLSLMHWAARSCGIVEQLVIPITRGKLQGSLDEHTAAEAARKKAFLTFDLNLCAFMRALLHQRYLDCHYDARISV